MFKRKLISLAVAGASALLATGAAQAGVMGQSVLQINNFVFLNPDGSTLNRNQFDVLIFQDSSQATANLNGVVATQTVNNNTFGPLDLPQQCVGDCVFGENNYSTRPAPSTLNVARADTLLQGAPIINPLVATPAQAYTVSESQLTSQFGSGNVQANLGLTATLQFVLGTTQTVGLSFDSFQYLIAAVGALDLPGSTARSSIGWSAELADSSGTTLFTWSPDGVIGQGITGGIETADGCDLTRTLNAQLPGQTTGPVSCTGSHLAYTNFNLVAGEFYTFGLRQTVETDITRQIPEPSALALSALALLGLGVASRRRRQA